MQTARLPTPSRRAQADRREGSERGLIEALLSIVEEEGVSAATFEAIGQRAGCSRGLVSQRFGSKKGLTRAAIDYIHALRDEELGSIDVEKKSGCNGMLTYVQTQLHAYAHNQEAMTHLPLLPHPDHKFPHTKTCSAHS